MAEEGPGHGLDPGGLDVDALYAAPPARFVEERKRLARALRAAGRRAEAQAIEKLTRPTVSVWATNQLARRERARVGELLELTDWLRDIQGRRRRWRLRRNRRASPGRAGGASYRRRASAGGGRPRGDAAAARSRGGEPARGRRGSRAADEAGRGPTGRRRGRQRVSRAAGGWDHRPERDGTNACGCETGGRFVAGGAPSLRTPKQRRPAGGRRRRPPAPPSGPAPPNAPAPSAPSRSFAASLRKPGAPSPGRPAPLEEARAELSRREQAPGGGPRAGKRGKRDAGGGRSRSRTRTLRRRRG